MASQQVEADGAVKSRTPTYGEDTGTVITERPAGTFSRQLFLGDTLDTEEIEASYEAGVLKLKIPVAERAKPRASMGSLGRVRG